MRKKKKIIRTNDREIYEKFNMLHFSPEIVVKEQDRKKIERVVKNINKNQKILSLEKLGTYILIKKVNPFIFDIYLK